jgi:hypothetical protein
MQTLLQVILALAIAALLLIALVVMLAIQVINMLARVEGPPGTPRPKAGRFDTERGTLE